MSKLTERLRDKGYYNNHHLLAAFGGHDDVCIEYHRPAEGRLGWCDVRRTEVWSPKKHQKLDTENRRSVFNSGSRKEFLGARKDSFSAALNWATEQFGHKYAPSPFGGYLPKHVLDKASAALSQDQH